jgi:hypothetical protein
MSEFCKAMPDLNARCVPHENGDHILPQGRAGQEHNAPHSSLRCAA